MNARFDLKAFRQTVKPRKPRRKSVNWLHVNIGAWEAKRLRALADCLGWELRGFLESAVRESYRKYEEEIARELGVERFEASAMSRAQRREFAERRWQIKRAVGVYADAHVNKN